MSSSQAVSVVGELVASRNVSSVDGAGASASVVSADSAFFVRH